MKGILGDTDVKEEHGCGVVGLESLAFKKKVYVCGLPNKTSVFELVQFFNKYAPIEVKEALPTRAAENKNISIAIHEQDSQLRRKKVFVDGIPIDTRASDIIKYFNIYAPVEDFFFDGSVQTKQFQRQGYIIFETEAAANYILKIRFFKFRNTLLEAKTALLGEVTKKENSALELNKQIQSETLVSHKNIAIQVADTNADLLHGHTFNSLDEPVLTGSANLALDPLPSSSTCQPLTSFTMQPVFYSEATQHPGFLFPAVVPHQLDTEYLSQLFFHSCQLHQNQASQDFHETVATYMLSAEQVTLENDPATLLFLINQPPVIQQTTQVDSICTGNEQIAQSFTPTTENLTKSQPFVFQTNEESNPHSF